MTFLTDTEKEDIAQRIHEIETHSRGEIVTVITQTSDDYRYVPLLWAALIALCVPGVWYLFDYFQQQGWQAQTDTSANNWMYTIQALVFLALAMLFQWAPLRVWLVPDQVKQQRASRNARAQFLSQQVHWTPHRAGILIFVSVAERYVEIIVDQAIAAKTENAEWDNTVNNFIEDVRAKRVASGFHRAIDDCKVVLEQHFSETDSDAPDHSNHLPNHLIEV